MTDREMVIKGLECWIDENHYGFKNCLTCAYRKNVDHLQYECESDRCIADAIELLKAQDKVFRFISKACMGENDASSIELILRRLAKLGYIDTDGEVWRLKDD